MEQFVHFMWCGWRCNAVLSSHQLFLEKVAPCYPWKKTWRTVSDKNSERLDAQVRLGNQGLYTFEMARLEAPGSETDSLRTLSGLRLVKMDRIAGISATGKACMVLINDLWLSGYELEGDLPADSFRPSVALFLYTGTEGEGRQIWELSAHCNCYGLLSAIENIDEK